MKKLSELKPQEVKKIFEITAIVTVIAAPTAVNILDVTVVIFVSTVGKSFESEQYR